VIAQDVLWRLFRAVAEVGAEAWPALLVELDPELAALAKRQPIGRLRDAVDSPREIVTRALTRLHARDFAAIKKLCAIDPPPELRAWLRVVVRHSAIDYVRASPEFQRAAGERPARWVSLATLSSGAAAAKQDSLAEKRTQVLTAVREMVERAAAEHAARGDDAFGRLAAEWRIGRIHVRRLAKRGQRYLEVLTSVFEGRSYPEIAERLDITRREVELTVRYIEELLVERGFGDS
jgi:DNA-directed RNA polymerase specialized sigma24 family protein